jgi:GMP synthase (glutamine-hydrolysing)
MTIPGGIVVLDFGSQYTQLIARRIREQGIYSAILPCNAALDEIRAYRPCGLVLSGGPSSVYDPEAPACDRSIFDLQVPILGICYGLQWLAHTLGGTVERAHRREYGPALLEVCDSSALLAGLPAKLRIWASHGDHVVSLPPGSRLVASTQNAVGVMEDPDRKIYAVQFHPEVQHTERGSEILHNFVFAICQAKPSWDRRSFVQLAVETIRQRVGKGKAICGLSGGVDSTVAATLVHRAIGDQLTCFFVDNGLLRQGEFADMLPRLERLGLRVTGVDASERFLARLAGVADPEEKRRRIGHEFIAVFEEEANKLGKVDFLVQGTLYPDVIESRSVRGPSATIKTHHNVGGLPDTMRLELIEPLRDLFKDEVRAVGRELALDPAIRGRHPFPGPGLAVRILGEVTPQRLQILRASDRILLDEIRQAGWYEKLWQAFAVLLPVYSVGVMGDARTYAYTLALRAVHSEDGMTADWARLPDELLERVSSRIVNEVRGVNRVVLDISSKPPSTIEWE